MITADARTDNCGRTLASTEFGYSGCLKVSKMGHFESGLQLRVDKFGAVKKIRNIHPESLDLSNRFESMLFYDLKKLSGYEHILLTKFGYKKTTNKYKISSGHKVLDDIVERWVSKYYTFTINNNYIEAYFESGRMYLRVNKRTFVHNLAFLKKVRLPPIKVQIDPKSVNPQNLSCKNGVLYNGLEMIEAPIPVVTQGNGHDYTYSL